MRASVASVLASGGVRASASRNVPTRNTGDCCSALDGELEQPERALVGPVQVVEHDDEGLACREVAQERRDGLEEAEPRRLRVGRVVGDR